MATKKLLGVALLLFVALALYRAISEEGTSAHQEGEPTLMSYTVRLFISPSEGSMSLCTTFTPVFVVLLV